MSATLADKIRRALEIASEGQLEFDEALAALDALLAELDSRAIAELEVIGLTARLEKAAGELQQLREALEQIMELGLFEKGNGLVEARRLARAALAGEDTPP